MATSLLLGVGGSVCRGTPSPAVANAQADGTVPLELSAVGFAAVYALSSTSSGGPFGRPVFVRAGGLHTVKVRVAGQYLAQPRRKPRRPRIDFLGKPGLAGSCLCPSTPA